MYVGLISDTHGVFDEEFKRFLEPVDRIWHAGDFGGGAETAQEIAAFKPLIGVYGNCDGQDIRLDYPQYDMMVINPGAAGIQGWHTIRTALRFRIEDGHISDMEVFNLPRA